jgi:MerR family transcriptional regulator, light-induced transcriptional regulator
VPEHLTTHDLARILHVSTATVRRWADSGLLPAIRTAGGHRRFSREVAELIARQKPPIEGRESTARWVELLVAPGAALDVDAALYSERHRRGAWHEVATLLGAVLEELGNRWERNELSVVHEHLASVHLTRSLARVSETLPTRRGGPRALLLTPEGEGHTLGLSLVELVIRECGWASIYAGSMVPTANALRYLASGGVDALLVSASVHSSPAALELVAEELSSGCASAHVPLVVGGRGPWPDRLASGEVIRDFPRLRAFVAAIDASHPV